LNGRNSGLISQNLLEKVGFEVGCVRKDSLERCRGFIKKGYLSVVRHVNDGSSVLLASTADHFPEPRYLLDFGAAYNFKLIRYLEIKGSR